MFQLTFRTSHTCGHEFIGEVVALGASFHSQAKERPDLYSTLRLGDKVVSPFTVNCGECHFCRLGFTCRCPQGAVFGSPTLEGGQAQYVRVPKAGGTLFNLTNPKSWSTTLPEEEKENALASIADSSLLLLADILPTGMFAALQALNHPKVLPIVTGRPWPFSFLASETALVTCSAVFQPEDAMLTFAVVGLGPVGVCTCVSLLDMLATRKLPFRVIGIDPIGSRRDKMKAIYSVIGADGKGSGEFVVASIEEAKSIIRNWTNGVVGNNDALALAFNLVRPFGVVVSVGVHQEFSVPFTGGQFYDKNVSFDFGRCPARAMFPMAFDLLAKRQDVFGGVGEEAGLIDKIVPFSEAAESYELFDKGKCGKVIFDPWK